MNLQTEQREGTLKTTLLFDEQVSISPETAVYPHHEKRLPSSPFLQSLQIKGHLTIREGKLRLWKTFGVLLPMNFLLRFVCLLKEEEAESFLFSLGRLQGKAAVEIQQQVFGLDKEKLLRNVLDQTELVGFGIVENGETEELDIMENLTCFYSHYVSEHAGYRLLSYIEGDITGIYETTYAQITKLLRTHAAQKYNIRFHHQQPILSKKEKEMENKLNAKSLITRASLHST